MGIKIIAGDLKGHILSGPKHITTRPILARVRKSLFDILTPNLTNATFLDLFSGTGAVGIEAVSRGAKHATLVDKDKTACDIINANLKYCKIENKSTVYKTDVFSFLNNCSQAFDIIFAGPPYPMNFSTKILLTLSTSKLLKPETIIIIQHHEKEILPKNTEKCIIYRIKKYGDTQLSFYKIV